MLALIIVYYRHPQELDNFLLSLARNQHTKFALFIADLSQDSKIDKRRFDFPIKLIPGQNKGFSHGANLALKAALLEGYDQFCVLNYDTYLDSRFAQRIIARFSHNDIFGGKIYYAREHEYHKDRYPKKDLGKVIWYAGGSINWRHALTEHRGVDEVDKGQYNKAETTDFITGCCLCFNRKVIDKIGFFDERYFLYFEDTDFCVRATNAGFKLLYDPQIILWHKNAAITGGSGSAFQTRLHRLSHLRFGLKHAPLRTKIHLVLNYLLKKNA